MIAHSHSACKVFAPIAWLWAVLWIGACGSSSAPPVFESPAVPNPASVPDFLPCPDGWREVPATSAEQVVTCDPWPATGYESCTLDGDVHFAGTPGCAAIGSACPVGDFAADLPAKWPIRYVLAGAPAGGDGSLGDPFDTIAVALATAVVGDIIALSKGDHPEAVSINVGIHLWGACVEQTRIVPAGVDVSATVVVDTSNVVLQDLQIAAQRPGIEIISGGAAVLNGVLVHDSEYFGVVVRRGGRVSGDRLVVRDIRPRSSDQAGGGGIDVQAGSALDLEQVLIERVVDVGVVANGVGANLKIDDFVVRETLPNAVNRDRGFGLELGGGGGAVIRRAVFESNSDRALSLSGADTRLLAQYVIVRDTNPRASDGLAGHALFSTDGAEFFLRYVELDHSRQAAIVVVGSSPQAHIADLIVRDTAERPDDVGGSAIVVGGAGTLQVARFFADGNFDRAVLISGASTVFLQDGWIRDTKSRSSDGRGGTGLEITGGSYADLTRMVFQRNRGVGVLLSGVGTKVDFNDTIIEATLSYESDGTSGHGMEVLAASFAHMHRTVVRDNRDIGVLVTGSGSRIEAADFVVSGTLPPRCAATSCVQSGRGVGVGTYDSAHALLESFALFDNVVCGAQLADGGTMDFHVGRIEQHPIGVNVQDSFYDQNRLVDRVDYVDNLADIDSSSLPLPVVN